MSAFSIFAYYIARLNIEIEKSSRGSFVRVGSQYVNSPKHREQRINIIKPFFLLFNFSSQVAYIIIVLSCKFLNVE